MQLLTRNVLVVFYSEDNYMHYSTINRNLLVISYMLKLVGVEKLCHKRHGCWISIFCCCCFFDMNTHNQQNDCNWGTAGGHSIRIGQLQWRHHF